MQPQSRGGRKVVSADWTSGANRIRDSLPSTVRCTRGFSGNPALPVWVCTPPLLRLVVPVGPWARARGETNHG